MINNKTTKPFLTLNQKHSTRKESRRIGDKEKKHSKKTTKTFSKKKNNKIKKTLNQIHSTKRVPEKLIRTILTYSVSKNFLQATTEWRPINYRKKQQIEGHINHNCDLCGQEELLHLFTIQNILTGKIINVVGSHCIFRHFILGKQVKQIMKFCEVNIHKRKMLYGKYKSEKIIDVLIKDPDYILQEIKQGKDFDDYLKSETFTPKQIDNVEISYKCMDLLYLIHVRGQYVQIDNMHLQNYLTECDYRNPHAKNYKPMCAATILKFIKTYDQ